MLDDDDGAAEPLLRPADDVDDRRGFFRRETGAGLVEQQHARLGQQRHRELEDLSLAMRELGRLARAGGEERIARLQLFQHRARPAAKARIEQGELAGAAAPQRDGEIVGDRQVGKDARNLQLAGDAQGARPDAARARRS